jgi:1-acyl-sn-glycerol-3-phosphate acyltransferase
MKCLPVCPVPRPVGLSNIPKDEPTIYVYNHISKRAEPFFLALAAPPRPPIRFFIDIKVIRPEIFTSTQTDVKDSVFSSSLQEKWSRHPLRRKILDWSSRFLTRFLMANLSRFNCIPVFVHPPRSPEEEIRKRRINREAFEDCISLLERHVPVAIAPSGGYTHQESTRDIVPTTLPSLAAVLQKRGKTLKIVPSVVREKPQVAQGTYRKYIADRILPYRLYRLLLDRLKIRKYKRPRLTVEFLPPMTFPYVNATKEEKVRFVQHLQQNIYDVLNRD